MVFVDRECLGGGLQGADRAVLALVSLENGAVAVEVLHLGGLHLIQLDGLCTVKAEILVGYKAGLALGVKLFVCICLELGR